MAQHQCPVLWEQLCSPDDFRALPHSQAPNTVTHRLRVPSPSTQVHKTQPILSVSPSFSGHLRLDPSSTMLHSHLSEAPLLVHACLLSLHLPVLHFLHLSISQFLIFFSLNSMYLLVQVSDKPDHPWHVHHHFPQPRPSQVSPFNTSHFRLPTIYETAVSCKHSSQYSHAQMVLLLTLSVEPSLNAREELAAGCYCGDNTRVQ